MSYSKKDVQKLVDDLGINPDDSEKWHVLGVAYLSLGEAEKAMDAFKRCLKLDENNTFALGDLGSLYILKGKNRQAIKHLERSLKIEPGKFEYWSALGVAYFQKGSYDDAIEAFHHCLAINPDYYDAVVSLGMTYSKMELWEKALETLTKAEKIIPNNYHAMKAITRSLRQLNRNEELKQMYVRMHALFPKDPSFPMYLGQFAFESGRRIEGLAYFQKAVEIDPESLIGWKTLSEALAKVGRNTEAQAARDKYKEIEERMKKANVRLRA